MMVEGKDKPYPYRNDFGAGLEPPWLPLWGNTTSLRQAGEGKPALFDGWLLHT